MSITSTVKCSGHTSCGPALCANDALLPRDWVEANVVAGIKRDLASPVVIEEMRRRRANCKQLSAAESQPSTRAADVTRLLADLPTRAARALEQLEKTLAGGDVARARQELKSHVGTVTVEADKREVRLYGGQGQMAAVLLWAAGGSAASFYGRGARYRVGSH